MGLDTASPKRARRGDTDLTDEVAETKVTARLPEARMARCAGKLAARAIWSSRSLKIEYLKRYVGGLVVFDDLADAYRVPRFFGRKTVDR